MPLRILHTADWHVGRTIARRSRIDEHRAVLAEIAEVAAERAVDVVVVAGDLFDRQNPSPDAERVVYDALADLRSAVPQVIVVAGNHDSPRRWEALAPLATGLHISARVDGDLSRHIVDVEGADGTRARVACLPWVPERHFLTAAHVSGNEPAPFADGISCLLDDLVSLAGEDGLPVVLAAHLNAAGALLGGGERPRAVADDTAVPADAFPARLSYAALGHIHRPQRVGARGAVHYSGSVLALDFAECEDMKGVVIAEVGDGAAAPVPVKLESGTRLHRLDVTLTELEAKAAAGTVPHGHVQVRLRCDSPASGLGDRVRELVEGCVDVRLVYPSRETSTKTASLRDHTLGEMFERYLVERAGFAEADPDLLARFHDLLGDTTADDSRVEHAA